jgi:hypothetical protein
MYDYEKLMKITTKSQLFLLFLRGDVGTFGGERGW